MTKLDELNLYFCFHFNKHTFFLKVIRKSLKSRFRKNGILVRELRGNPGMLALTYWPSTSVNQ